ncbi:MAG: STAS domain-containing protein [Bacteroides sp.]|nr:STAS domain-containing protein [Prevotella sp.]MCM1407455.1 STAS domain-containing protein [Treponema brennaborense]MCM1469945.1 STAS domain-containing protein [Bacteroides sp.]
MNQIQLQEKKGANYMLLEVQGMVTSYTFTEFQKKAYSFINESNLIIDLAEVTEIDSSGLSVIFGAYNDGKANGHTLYIMRPSIEARRALDSTGFTDMFPIIYSVTEVG